MTQDIVRARWQFPAASVSRATSSRTALQTLVTSLLSVFVFAMPTDMRLWGSVSVTLPVGTLCIALGFLSVLERREIFLVGTGCWYWLAFVFWSTFSLTWASYPDATFPKLVKYWEFLPVTWVITQYAWERRIRMQLFDAYLIGCWCGVLGVFFNFVIHRDFYISGANELEDRYSFGTDPNFLALALVIGAVTAFYRFYTERTRYKRILFAVYIPASFLALALIGSRGALLALLAATAWLLVGTNARKRIAVIVGAGLLLILTAALPSSVTWRLSTTTDELNNGTLDGRRGLWDEGTILVRNHPLEGIGVGGAKGALALAAHNTPLELLIEGGVISLALFYGGFVHSLYAVWKSRAKERTVLVAISMAWFVGTLSISWDAHLITWLIYALFLSVGSARKPLHRLRGVGPLPSTSH